MTLFDTNDTETPQGYSELGDIPFFWNFVWAADEDYTISIKYYSELVNHVSGNWEVLARRKYTDNFGFLL